MVAQPDVLKQYDIRRVKSCKPLNKGNTSDAMLVDTEAGAFVLRKLNDEQQGWKEYILAQKLAPTNISPKIRCAKNGMPYATYLGVNFNIQEYKGPVNESRTKKLNWLQLGKLVGRFHHLTEEVRLGDQEDRYDLLLLWKAVGQEIRNSSESNIRTLGNHMMQCKSYSVNRETVIHGDLGIWNLLFTERHVFIIDMAEARMGDRHFDLAAVITSSIPLTASRTEMEKSLSLFERGYAQEHGVWDNRRLFEQLHLWLLRGMLALVRDQGMSAPNVSYIERQLKILEEYKSLLV